MKKIFFLVFFALVIIAKSQTVPKGINYQAVVRNNTGVVLIGSTVNMKFELFNSASGPVIYTETHNGLSTGLVGVVTCSIGMGTTTNTFSVDVNWSNGDVWYQAYLDIGSGMNPIGAKQKFMTVPYSFYAKEVPVVSTGSVLTIGTKTVALNSGPTYTAGAGISIIGGIISNTSSAAVTPTLTGAGSTTVTGIYPTLTITSPTVQTYSAGSGISISGGVISNTAVVGGNGIYGGSGALTSSLTTVSVGTNTLSFSGASNSTVADFMNNGTESFINVIHSGSNSASVKFKGLLASVPNYGSITGNSNGVSVNAGSYLNTITTSTLGDVWLNSLPSSSNEGRMVINHTASLSYPTIHLKETTTSLNRIKFSNIPVAGKYFEIASQTNAVDGNGALSMNYFDGLVYKPVLLINGDKQVFVNALNIPLSTFHVMTNPSSAPNGIISEGFALPGKISIARNNNPGAGGRLAVNNADELGRLTFSGFNTSNLADGASIRAVATQLFTGGTNGTEMIFSTVLNGFSTLQDVMKLTNDGKVVVTNTLTIPIGGGLGKVLTSDAFGNASWQTTAGSSAWTYTLGNLYPNNFATDKVGIGNNNPQSVLDVTTDGSLLNGVHITNTASTNGPTIYFKGQSKDWTITGSNSGSGSGANKLVFRDYTSAADRMVIDGTGKVGIGTTSPTAKLNVYTNLALEEGVFSDAGSSSNTNAIRGITAGTGNAAFFGIYNPTSPGKAIEAQSNNQVATIGASNICTAPGDAIYASSINGRAIYATSSSGSYSALEVTNTNVQPAILASKTGTASGTVVLLTSSNLTNPFPILSVQNSGTAPSIKATVGSAATSKTSLLLDEGHIAHHQTYPGFSIGSSLSNMSFGYTGATDVAGSIVMANATTMAPTFSQIITITFSKTYAGNSPVVVLTPLSQEFANLNYWVSSSSSGFVIHISNLTSLTISPTAGTQAFSYHVIGIE